VIDILEAPEVIRKKVKRAVTDTGTEIRFDAENKPGVSNLLTIASTLSGTPIADLERAYDGKGYGALKADVAEIVVEFTDPLRERTQEWLDNPDQLDKVLAEGSDRARAVAGETLGLVYDAVGFLPPRP
jgi:tryptophanyl-tRNA synthetase